MASIVKQIREFGLTADIVPFYLAELDVDAVGQALLAGLRSENQLSIRHWRTDWMPITPKTGFLFGSDSLLMQFEGCLAH